MSLHSANSVARVSFEYLKLIPLLIEACAVLIADLLAGLLSNWWVVGSRNGEQQRRGAARY